MKDIGVVDMVLGMEIKRDIAQKKFFCVKGSTSKMCSDVLGWNVLKSWAYFWKSLYVSLAQQS